MKVADADPAIPRDRAARLALLRRGLIPWLAGIDPDTGAPRRRVARLSEIPAEARPLIQHLVEQRLLATDVNKETGEATIEPAHEALLRQWGMLEGWLTEDAGLLAVLEGIKRASRDWAANNRSRPGLRTRPIDWLLPSGCPRGPTSPPTSIRRTAITSPRAARRRPTQSADGGCCRELFMCPWSPSSSAWLAGSISRS